MADYNSLRPSGDSGDFDGGSLRSPSPSDNQDTQKKKDTTALSAQEIDWYVAELRYRTALYLEFVQSMIDGVTLAAEQVQDKRLEFSQEVTKTGVGAEIFLFALTLVLEGTIGPAIAAVATSVVFAPLLKSAAKALTVAGLIKSPSAQFRLFRQEARALSQQAMRSNDPSLTSADRVRMVLRAENLNAAAKQIVSNSPQARVRSVETIRALLNFTQDNLVALAKAGIEVGKVPDASTPSSANMDTAGVAIRGAAMTSASKLRLTLRAIHEVIEANLRNPSITKDDADKMLKEYWIEGECQYDLLRHYYQSITEVMIWARIIFPGMQAGTQSISDTRRQLVRGDPRYPLIAEQDPNIGGPGFLVVPGLSEAATLYLVSRFSEEVERWALLSNAHGPHEFGSATSPRPTGWWESLPQTTKTDFLVQYLQMISGATPKEFIIHSGK